MTALIRQVQPDDAGAIQAIYAPIVRDTPISFELEPPLVEEMRRRIVELLDDLPWLVCDLDGSIAGYAYATRHRQRPAYQWSVESSVYVDVAFQRCGIGRALYASLLEILKLQGHRNVLAGIVLPNPASEALHRRCGYEPTGVFRAVGFKLGRWHDVAWWHRSLQGDSSAAPSLPQALSHVRSGPAFSDALGAGLPFIRPSIEST